MHQEVVHTMASTKSLCCSRFGEHREANVAQAVRSMDTVPDHIVEVVHCFAGAMHRSKTDTDEHHRRTQQAAGHRQKEQVGRVDDWVAEEAAVHSPGLAGVEKGLTVFVRAAVVIQHNIPQIRLLVQSAADSAPSAHRRTLSSP